MFCLFSNVLIPPLKTYWVPTVHQALADPTLRTAIMEGFCKSFLHLGNSSLLDLKKGLLLTV